jgi:hypothetical protein
MKMAKAKTSIFTEAKVVAAPVEKEKKDKNEKREVNLGESLDIVAAISALTDTLESIKKTLDSQLKDQMTAEFVEEAIKTQRKPESFRGVGSVSSVSCEIRKRSSRSVLKPEEVVILNRLGIKTEKKVTKEAIQEHYFFNSKAFDDPKLVQEISDRLDGLTTADGEGLMMKQEGRAAVESDVVDADVLNEAAKSITDVTDLTTVYKIVATNALGKFKLADPSLENVFSILRDALVI